MNLTTLPKALKDLRKSAGLTMKEVATRLGVSAAAVDHWEGGRRTPDPTQVEAYVQACGKKLVFEIVEPATETASVQPMEREMLDLWRSLTPERRRVLSEFAHLLPRARQGAEGAAIAVLRSLQELPSAPGRAAGEIGE